jgi:hypothetical protein
MKRSPRYLVPSEVKERNRIVRNARTARTLRGRAFEERCKCVCGKCVTCKTRDKVRRWRSGRYRALARYGLLPEQLVNA